MPRLNVSINFVLFLLAVLLVLRTGEPSLLDAISARIADVPVSEWRELRK